ncbi:MAG: periplasmic heavy metal sensor [Pseudomonadota bacterium]
MSATGDTVPSIGPDRSRVWRVILIASLSLNLLFVGLWAGHAMRDEPEARPGSDTRFQARVLGLIPESKHGDWEMVYAEGNEDRDALRTEIRGRHQEMIRILRAAPFELERFEQALSDRRRLSNDLRQARHGALIELVGTMSPEERVEMATRFERGSGR